MVYVNQVKHMDSFGHTSQLCSFWHTMGSFWHTTPNSIWNINSSVLVVYIVLLEFSQSSLETIMVGKPTNRSNTMPTLRP